MDDESGVTRDGKPEQYGESAEHYGYPADTFRVACNMKKIVVACLWAYFRKYRSIHWTKHLIRGEYG